MGVHAGALGLAVLCGVYNAAAWLTRRERHLAINTILYTALSLWEQQHVVHHLAEMRKPLQVPDAAAPLEPEAPDPGAPMQAAA